MVEAGGKAAESIEQAVKDADVVAIMVPDSPQVQAFCWEMTGSSPMLSPAPS